MPTSPFLSKYRSAAAVRSRPLLIGACVVWVLVILGCMSLSFGGRHGVLCPVEEPFCQEGVLRLSPGSERQVYYPLPFASPPYLEFKDPHGDFIVLEQHPDHFKVKCRDGSFPVTPTRWTARGLRATPPAAPNFSNAVPVPSLPPPAVDGPTSPGPTTPSP